MSAALAVIAKEPLPGRSKTRLCPPLDHQQAAALAAAALADTLEAVAGADTDRRVLVLDGAPGPWLPAGFEVIAQRGAGLAQRLRHAVGDIGEPLILLGMDTPQLTATLLNGALQRLEDDSVDAILGPTPDGGYWTIGLRDADPRVFEGVPMSSAGTCAAQRERLAHLGLRIAELQALRDVDTFDDIAVVAALAPATRFAAAVAQLGL